jgi:hypothetical protein
VPANFAAKRPALLFRNPARDRSCRHASGLQNKHASIPTSAGGTRVVLPAPGRR